MEILFLVFGWILMAALIGIVGSNKKIGYGGVFLISLFLSPLIGLIVGLLSADRVAATVSSNAPYLLSIREAEMAENRGEVGTAIKYYQDALYHLKDAYLTTNSVKRNYRTKIKSNVEDKLFFLQNKQID